MPPFLSDPSQGFYIILVLVTVVTCGIAAKYQDRGSLIRAAVALGLLLALFFCDRAYESPREESIRKVQELSEAVNKRDEAKFLSLVSDSFAADKLKKQDTKTIVNLAKQHNVRTSVWDFNRDYFKMTSDTELELTFDAKAEGPNGEPFLRHFKVKFGRDADGQWRLRSFTPYSITSKTSGSPESIPGL